LHGPRSMQAIIKQTLVVIVLLAACTTERERMSGDTTQSSGTASATALSTTAVQRSQSDAGTAAPKATNVKGSASTPADVLRRYYREIQARDFNAAYSEWAGSGEQSGQTKSAFAAGFAKTREVRATVSDSVQSGAAAGSQYATVPVVVDAILNDGTRQHFVGTYTVRRAMVDGATAEQRQWHIYSADLHQR
jgi:hypothetical protein